MTKKEIAYIEAKAAQYKAWAEEELKEMRRSTDPEEKKEHELQARLNSAAGNTLQLILTELGVY